MINKKIFSVMFVCLMMTVFQSAAKRVPSQERETYEFSLEYINSIGTFNRSLRALGYDVNQMVYGIQGENCSPSEGDITALSKGSLYGVCGYQFLNTVTFAGLAGYGDSYYNQEKFQYGAMCSLHLLFVNVSLTYNTTSKWGVGVGIYLK